MECRNLLVRVQKKHVLCGTSTGFEETGKFPFQAGQVRKKTDTAVSVDVVTVAVLKTNMKASGASNVHSVLSHLFVPAY
ncbi:hypothetical protein NPIL_678781 [Nephila pilipes]|uniref:Uncharacterized protein n=1 Tax=Nephila pilipes TaxID=299642 RepID=A0A8X6PSU4_NEPPI|nr:hypothetical protein NPIL_678781 [Nephila pilipes]